MWRRDSKTQLRAARLLIMISHDITTDLAPQQPIDKSAEFDYSTLADDTPRVLQQQIREIKENLQQTVSLLWENGRKLSQILKSLKRRRFEAWLEAEFPRSRSIAYNQINVYLAFGENLTLAHLPIDEAALYQLAAPSTPVAARAEALERAATGEIISLKTAKSIISTKKISRKKQKTVFNNTEHLAPIEVKVVDEVLPVTESKDLLPENCATQKLDEKVTIDVVARAGKEDQLSTEAESSPPSNAVGEVSEQLFLESAGEEITLDSTESNSIAALSKASEPTFNSDSSFTAIRGQSPAAFTPNSNSTATIRQSAATAYSTCQTLVSNLGRLDNEEAHSILRAFLQKLGLAAINTFVKELKQEEIATLCNQCLGFLNERGLKWLEIETSNFAALSETAIKSLSSKLKRILISKGTERITPRQTQSEPSNLIYINAIG